MGIFCNIQLNTPTDGEYTPGGVVSGVIKYSLDKEYEFSAIIVSLKGLGRLRFDDKRKKRKDGEFKYFNYEDYVDIDHVIYTNEKKDPLPVGHYETPFSFKLPQDLPPSLTLFKETVLYRVWCFIMYYVRIKFERPGVFNLSKRLKKEITVKSGGTPRLETHPLAYSNDKTLLELSKLFSSKKGKVTLKGTIDTSVVQPGENIKVDFEIENITNVVIKAVKIKLVEEYKFMLLGHYDVDDQEDMDGVAFIYGEIQPGETKNFVAEIPIPANCGSVNNSSMIARDYVLRTTVVLPMPHINLNLEIPVEVMDRGSTQDYNATFSNPEYPRDDPPSYWEAMSEEAKKIDDEFDFDDKN